MATKTSSNRTKQTVTFGDLEGKTPQEIREHIIQEFGLTADALIGFDVLMAWQSDDGYESSNWFLLKKGAQLFENHGSHCSCYGYEDQWKPEKTTRKYLKSEKFSCHGPRTEVQDWIKENL